MYHVFVSCIVRSFRVSCIRFVYRAFASCIVRSFRVSCVCFVYRVFVSCIVPSFRISCRSCEAFVRLRFVCIVNLYDPGSV